MHSKLLYEKKIKENFHIHRSQRSLGLERLSSIYGIALVQYIPGDFRGEVMDGRFTGVTEERLLDGLSGRSPRSSAS